MSKENLYKQVLRNEVVIWAGAGMSKYAGYPLGEGLRDIIYQDLGQEAKQALNPNGNLLQMAEDYCSLKGGSRRELNMLLSRVFLAKPTSTETHDLLAKIPQIKTVITTNYDNLFENAYGERAHKIFNTSHLTLLDDDKIEVFKAHGDLYDPNSLIITSKDYSKFFQNSIEYNSFWTTIKERIIGNSVLFIGYGIEDINVESVLGKIFDEIGSNQKQIFFVSPNLPQFKVDDLIRRRIQYINDTGENLILDMFNFLKENVIDFSKKNPNPNIVSSAAKFVNNFGLGFLQSGVGGYQKVSSVFPTRPDIKGTLNFSLTEHSNVSQDLTDFLNRKKLNAITISKEKFKALNFHLGEIRIPVNFTELTILAMPNFEGKVLLRFDDGFEYSDVNAKLYSREDAVEIQARLVSGDVKFELFIKDRTRRGIRAKFQFTHDARCSSIRDEIEMYSLLVRICKNTKFCVFGPDLMYKDAVLGLNLTGIKHFASMLEYFKLLREIELREMVVFKNIAHDEITDENFEKASFLVAKYKNERVKMACNNELTMTSEEPKEIFLQKLSELKKTNSVITAKNGVEEYINLHGNNIRLGYLVIEYPSPYIVNERRFLKGTDAEIVVKSKEKIQYVRYLDTNE